MRTARDVTKELIVGLESGEIVLPDPDLANFDFSVFKPCPFCGCKEIGVSRLSFGPDTSRSWKVSARCRECSAESGWFFVHPGSLEYPGMAEALPEIVRRWNRRPPEVCI